MEILDQPEKKTPQNEYSKKSLVYGNRAVGVLLAYFVIGIIIEMIFNFNAVPDILTLIIAFAVLGLGIFGIVNGISAFKHKESGFNKYLGVLLSSLIIIVFLTVIVINLLDVFQFLSN